jgi:hypothetical protein
MTGGPQVIAGEKSGRGKRGSVESYLSIHLSEPGLRASYLQLLACWEGLSELVGTERLVVAQA